MVWVQNPFFVLVLLPPAAAVLAYADAFDFLLARVRIPAFHSAHRSFAIVVILAEAFVSKAPRMEVQLATIFV